MHPFTIGKSLVRLVTRFAKVRAPARIVMAGLGLLWAQGGVIGYVVYFYLARYQATSGSFGNALIDRELGTLIYIELGTTLAFGVFGWVSGHFLEKIDHQKMELEKLNDEKSHFAAACSHDLRSPLNSILGVVDLMLEDEDTLPKSKEALDHVKNAAGLLLDLSNEILELSESQLTERKLTVEPLSLAEVARPAVVAARRLAAGKAITILFESDIKDNDLVQGNMVAMTRIFNNLLSNAIKFSHRNGEIRVLLKKGKTSNVEIAIEDDGLGIAADKLSILFERFTGAARVGTEGEKSTGLGMSIVKALVERQHGLIGVQSELGQGTRLDLAFPLITSSVEQYSPSLKGDSLLGFETVPSSRILLVDDDPVNLMVVKKWLTLMGHHTVTAENGQLAVEVFQNGEFDLVFMDHHMPVKNGLEATISIRDWEKSNNREHTPILCLTGAIRDEDRLECQSAGMDSLIAKPVSRLVLQRAIAEFTIASTASKIAA